MLPGEDLPFGAGEVPVVAADGVGARGLMAVADHVDHFRVDPVVAYSCPVAFWVAVECQHAQLRRAQWVHPVCALHDVGYVEGLRDCFQGGPVGIVQGVLVQHLFNDLRGPLDLVVEAVRARVEFGFG